MSPLVPLSLTPHGAFRPSNFAFACLGTPERAHGHRSLSFLSLLASLKRRLILFLRGCRSAVWHLVAFRGSKHVERSNGGGTRCKAESNGSTTPRATDSLGVM